MGVADNLARLRESMGTRPVKLIAVTKQASTAQIEEAFRFGVRDFGENRIQDATAQRKALPPSVETGSNWHFIGHLQTNKVKQAVGNYALIHSVDSLKLASAISQEAAKKGLVQPILIQVKVEDDEAKSGLSLEETRKIFPELMALPHIEVRGLMTITPLTDDHSIRERCFRGLQELQVELSRQYGKRLKELSMGMSADWQQAIVYGATMIRLGRAIFSD